MSSSYKRIQSDSIKYGDSFVLSYDSSEEAVTGLTVQKKLLQKEIEMAKAELAELKNSLKDLFEQKDTIIERAKKDGEEIKTKAILKSEEIISEANAKRDAVIEESKATGHKQGFEAGYNDGNEKFKADYKKQLESLTALLKASFEVKNEIVFSAETDILELAMLIAEKVVQVEFQENKECFKNMVQTAISLLREKEKIKIVVNPKFVEYANELSPDLLAKIDGIEEIKIIQDKSVSPDGAVVEALDSRIDARISTQMETLARTLLIDKRIQETLTDEIEEKISAKIKQAQKDE